MADDDRGRGAERPTDIPARGWRDVLLRTRRQVSEDNLSLVAAGVAFYAMLALFPAIAALVSLWGLVADPQTIQQQIASLANALPEDAAGIVRDQLSSATSNSQALGLTAIGGLLLTIYSASKGTTALMAGLNIAYDEEETRGTIARTAIAVGLMVLALVVAVLALGLIGVLPAVLGLVGLGGLATALVNIARWPLLALFVVGYLALAYRWGPDRKTPKLRWASPGALIATVGWLLLSGLFSIYVNNFGSYNETYGTLGAVVVLLTWFWLSSLVILIGAEINNELERQTGEDTTTGPPEPFGSRGAFGADTVGDVP